jgi:hypothetical protein
LGWILVLRPDLESGLDSVMMFLTQYFDLTPKTLSKTSRDPTEAETENIEVVVHRPKIQYSKILCMNVFRSVVVASSQINPKKSKNLLRW